MDTPDLIVLCGPPRSGTTWLNRQICENPAAFPFIPECSFITQQLDLYYRTRHFTDKPRVDAYFGDDGELLDYFRDNVARLIARAALLNHRTGARHLILKDPALTLYLHDLDQVLPPHRLVVLVRDPRDVIASMKTVLARRQQRWSIKQACAELANYYYQMENHRQRPSANCMFVRYEDLAGGNFDQLAQFLGIAVSTGRTNGKPDEQLRDKLDPTDACFTELYLQPTTASRIGRYREQLSGGEIRHAERVFAGALRQWRYPISTGLTSIAARIARTLRRH